MHPELELQIKTIAGDNVTGASELSRRAVEVLRNFSHLSKARSVSDYYDELIVLARALINAQPSMASMFNAVNGIVYQVRRAVERNIKLKELRKITRDEANNYIMNSKRALERIAGYGSELINDNAVVMTYSYSSAVLKVLLRAREKINFRVIVPESRPMFEGREMASDLGDKGVRTTLIVDSAMFHFLKEIDIVLVGADCVTKQGIMNKVGTLGLAIASWNQNVPFYCVCESSKFLPFQLKAEEKSPSEVLREGMKNVTVQNIYFDFTPIKYITGIITEHGIILKESISRHFEVIRVCDELLP